VEEMKESGCPILSRGLSRKNAGKGGKESHAFLAGSIAGKWKR
jgi:hypothetical protein